MTQQLSQCGSQGSEAMLPLSHISILLQVVHYELSDSSFKHFDDISRVKDRVGVVKSRIRDFTTPQDIGTHDTSTAGIITITINIRYININYINITIITINTITINSLSLLLINTLAKKFPT